MQRAAGVAALMEDFDLVRSQLPPQHRSFFASLPFIVLASVDPQGDCWASLLCGRPGFVSSPDASTLVVAAAPPSDDPTAKGLFQEANPVGILGIELHTRRRNRANGTARRGDGGGGLRVAVAESFGNCPQYIQLRDCTFARDPEAPAAVPAAVQLPPALDATARSLIERADTFFIASFVDIQDAGRRVDVSHRGGRPGFVRVAPDGRLLVPDFTGNNMFCTLGNLVANPRCGLVFVDWAAGDTLHLSGDAAVVLTAPEQPFFRGAERFWYFTRDAERLRLAWRPYAIVRRVEESAAVTSFYLAPADGGALLAFAAGQHIPVRLGDLHAAFSLSLAPSDDAGAYRISVKRDGALSRRLVDAAAVGDRIEARAPTGRLAVDALAPSLLLLFAGGVGITPLLSILKHVVFEGLRKRQVRPTLLIYATRTSGDRAFDRELAALCRAAAGAVSVCCVTTEPPGERPTVALVRRLVGGWETLAPECDAYLCGPGSFAQSLYEELLDDGVPDERIHAEAFGPAALRRRGAARSVALSPATGPVPVLFSPSGVRAEWRPDCRSLLLLAEAAGLEIDSSCRKGTCGTCRVKVKRGAVAHAPSVTFTLTGGDALACSAVPAAGTDALELGLI